MQDKIYMVNSPIQTKFKKYLAFFDLVMYFIIKDAV